MKKNIPIRWLQKIFCNKTCQPGKEIWKTFEIWKKLNFRYIDKEKDMHVQIDGKKCWQSFYYKNTIYYKENNSAAG